MNGETSLIRAAFLAPMDAPVIRDGAFAVRAGRIAGVGRYDDVRAAHPTAPLEDLGDAIILPGLVNAHAHLELSSIRCAPLGENDLFTDWIGRIAARVAPEHLERDVNDAIREGAAQCLRFGVTCVGDITLHAPLSRAALRSLPNRPRVVSYAEVLGLAKRRSRFDELFAAAIGDLSSSAMLRAGLTPHAPYSVDRPSYEKCVQAAREHNLPLATHLAETLHEREFLESHGGAFRDFLERIGSFEEPIDTFRGSPIAFAHSIGLLAYPTLLAHVNYCNDDELSLLSRGHASVVYCPRTHAYFRHPSHRWREMLARGINVAVGTDSCASSPDLNLLDDVRLLHHIAPEINAQTLFEMATIRAARAVRMEDEVGSLTTGKAADFTVFEMRANASEPLRDLLETRSQVPMKTHVAAGFCPPVISRRTS